MLEANLKLLRLRFPIVLKRILDSGNHSSSHFKFQQASQEAQLHTIRGDKIFPTYGPGKKDSLISRWFKNLPIKHESLYAVTGFGDGSHIRHALENTRGGTFLLTIEKEPHLLKETFSRIDCSDILSNER